jgi:tetratricopeptide (TPR) repeat protein
MLETIKAYAAAQLDARPEFATAAHEGHARHFVELATEAAPETVVAELDNLRMAWAHTVAQQDLGRLETLRDALWPIYEARGWYHATIALADDMLAVLSSSPDADERWQARLSLMTSRAKAITLLRGYAAEAEDAYGEALALVKERGEVPQLFPVLRNLGSFYGYRGELDKAIEYANEILRLADAENDASMRVTGYVYLGANSGFAGDVEGGLGYLEKAIETFESSGYESRRLRLGLDPRVSCLTTTGFFLWFRATPTGRSRGPNEPSRWQPISSIPTRWRTPITTRGSSTSGVASPRSCSSGRNARCRLPSRVTCRCGGPWRRASRAPPGAGSVRRRRGDA